MSQPFSHTSSESSNDTTTTLQDLKNRIQQFNDEREWGQFHTPKNLVMALTCEATELMEHFLWIENTDSIEELALKRSEVEAEIADIFAYLIRLCQLNNIDLTTAVIKKMQHNAQKYPLDQCKGKKEKYTAYNRE